MDHDFPHPRQPAELEAFYQRQLGPTGVRWYSAKGLGNPAYLTNPLLWSYDNDYCPRTKVLLSWASAPDGLLDVRVQVSERYCGYFPLYVAWAMFAHASGR